MTGLFQAAFRERDFFLLTIDALRYDVARDALAKGAETVKKLHERGTRLSAGAVAVPAHLERIEALRALLPTTVPVWINAQKPNVRYDETDQKALARARSRLRSRRQTAPQPRPRLRHGRRHAQRRRRRHPHPLPLRRRRPWQPLHRRSLDAAAPPSLPSPPLRLLHRLRAPPELGPSGPAGPERFPRPPLATCP